MRLLFDENAPFSLARELVGHDCSHVIRLGWRGTKNGALLARAEEAGFEVLITLDEDMKFEQNMTGRKIAILVVKPLGQGKMAMKSMAGRVLSALVTLKPGDICVVGYRDET